MYRNVNLVDGKLEYKKIATGVDAGKLDGLGDGTAAASWTASAGRINLTGRFIGSPGTAHAVVGGTGTVFTKAPADVAAPGGIVINEVRNDTSDDNLDWIEVFNNSALTAPSKNVNNFELSMVTATLNDDGTYTDFADTRLALLPNYKMAPGEYLVVYNRHPGDTILAGGQNIADIAAGRQVNKGASHVYIVSAALDLPSDKKFLIILRNGNDKSELTRKLKISPVTVSSHGLLTDLIRISGPSSDGLLPRLVIKNPSVITRLLMVAPLVA